MLKVSVIIATYNRCDQLKMCIDSLLDQVCNGGFCYDIVVVDNNSSDATKGMVLDYQLKHDGKIEYVFVPEQGKSNALNKGVEIASGDIIAFTDDDVIADKQWLAYMVNTFKNNDCACVGGRVLPLYPDETPEWIKGDKDQMAGIVVTCDNGEEIKEFKKGMNEFLGANYAFKKDVFKNVGNFRTDMGPGISKPTTGEDREFVGRLIKNNMSVYYCGQALIRHPVDLSRAKLMSIIKWNISLGRAVARKEYENTQQRMVHWCGVPRYLFKGIIQDFLMIICHIFNKRLLFDSLKSFYRKVGMIKEYRKNSKLKLNGERSHA